VRTCLTSAVAFWLIGTGDPGCGDEVIAVERLHGAFTRQLFLGETLDAERLLASYETGVLTLRIPVAESATP